MILGRFNLKTALLFILLSVLLSVLLGWFATTEEISGGGEFSDQWEELYISSGSEVDYNLMSKQIMTSPLIAKVADEDRPELETQLGNAVLETQENEVSPFPEVVSAAILDDVPVVALAMADGGVEIFRSGDVLASGWELVFVSMSQVAATYEGEEYVVKIADYKQRESLDND